MSVVYGQRGEDNASGRVTCERSNSKTGGRISMEFSGSIHVGRGRKTDQIWAEQRPTIASFRLVCNANVVWRTERRNYARGAMTKMRRRIAESACCDCILTYLLVVIERLCSNECRLSLWISI